VKIEKDGRATAHGHGQNAMHYDDAARVRSVHPGGKSRQSLTSDEKALLEEWLGG